MNRSPFRILLALYRGRFFQDETVSPGSGFETNIYQVLGFLVTVGFAVAYLATPLFVELSFQVEPSPRDLATLRMFRMFLPALTFAVVGFVTAFEWDTLFPDRRDFLVLSQFPLPIREILAAKIAALGQFIGLLVLALDVFPTIATVVYSFARSRTWQSAARLAATQTLTLALAALLAFLLVAIVQGILIVLMSPRAFTRISPWMQMAGMSVMVLAIVTFPIYALPAVATRPWWQWWFPPVFLTGLYDALLPDGDVYFAPLGRHSLQVAVGGLFAFLSTWTLGFGRHYRRTLETEDLSRATRSGSNLRFLASSPEEWAMFSFCRKTLTRSAKHRLFLATWISVGLAIGIVTAVGTDAQGHLRWSPGGVRSFPFLLAFFAVSGLRTVFQFPADLACNWIMRITESRWSEKARRVTRRVAIICGLLPVLLTIWPAEMYAVGIGKATAHVLFQFAIGCLLVELTFWSFDKLPFTCSYFAGKTSLSLLLLVYLYGFTSYAFNMADLEAALDLRPFMMIPVLVLMAAMLTVLSRNSREPVEVIFDGSEPAIQTLDLN